MWKDIEGYEGYKINENGVVLNKKGHMMRQALSNVGRPRVSLEVYDEDGNLLHRDNKSIHRLVAQAFIENPNNLPLVMHKDNDPLHNHVSNLKWEQLMKIASRLLKKIVDLVLYFQKIHFWFQMILNL